MYMYLVVHDVAVGLCGRAGSKRSHVINQLIGNDPQGPPVTADTIVGPGVQAGENLRSYVLWGADWQTRLQLISCECVCVCVCV